MSQGDSWGKKRSFREEKRDKDKRQPKMARLVARWRRFNFLILVTVWLEVSLVGIIEKKEASH